MFPIDKRKIKREVERLGDTNKKTVKGVNVPPVADAYKQSVWNLMDTLQGVDAYSMAQWLVHVDRWIDDIGKEVRTKYERGDIVFIELGAMNFGYEASYEHPAIVIANAYNTVLIAPCSSKSFGRGHRDVIDLPKTAATGLSEDTGVGVGGIRWISKNRILNRSGNVTNPIILDKIEAYLLNQLYFHKVLTAHLENQLFDLERKQNKLEAELEEKKSILISVEELLLRHSPELEGTFKEIASGKTEK